MTVMDGVLVTDESDLDMLENGHVFQGHNLSLLLAPRTRRAGFFASRAWRTLASCLPGGRSRVLFYDRAGQEETTPPGLVAAGAGSGGPAAGQYLWN